jgi:hypothetical protein
LNFLESTKTVVGSTVTSAAGTATLTVDTLGYAYASVDVLVATSATPANTSASILNVLTLSQGDTNTAGSSVYTVAVPAASVAVTACAGWARARSRPGVGCRQGCPLEVQRLRNLTRPATVNGGCGISPRLRHLCFWRRSMPLVQRRWD